MKFIELIVISIFLLTVQGCVTNKVNKIDRDTMSLLLSDYSWSAISKYPFDDPRGKIVFCSEEHRKSFEFIDNFKKFRYKEPENGYYKVLNIGQNKIELEMLSGRDDNLKLWNIVFESKRTWYWERPDGSGNKWYRYRCDTPSNNKKQSDA